jgi:hypothetical protein
MPPALFALVYFSARVSCVLLGASLREQLFYLHFLCGWNYRCMLVYETEFF